MPLSLSDARSRRAPAEAYCLKYGEAGAQVDDNAAGKLGWQICIAGWSSQAARRAHNPEVAGSNPAPATTKTPHIEGFLFYFSAYAILSPIAMTLTTHAVIGAAIGSVVGSPLLGFVLGAASHFLVDMIPHGDNELADKYRLHKKKKAAVAYVTVDAAIAIILLMTIVSGRSSNTTNIAFSAAVAGSIMPDLLVGLGDIYKHQFLKKFSKLHFFFHDFFSRKYGDTKLAYALTGQAVFIIVLMRMVA